MTELSPIALELREGLRRLAKAVVVITCRHAGTRYAMAATAVSELSMNPPSLLICINRSASLYAPISRGVNFGVNILHADHREISEACGGKAKGEDRFTLGQWADAEDGCPILEDAQASFLCRQEQSTDYGTHRIVIGRVLSVRIRGEVNPLVYADGRYLPLGEFPAPA